MNVYDKLGQDVPWKSNTEIKYKKRHQKSLVITEPSTSLDIQEMFRKGKHKQTKQVTLYLLNWLSEQERRVDALALRADERRDKLR